MESLFHLDALMPAPIKYNEVMSVIKQRIREGDYFVESIPGERRLAEETGVSYMTARRAVLQLLEEKVLKDLARV